MIAKGAKEMIAVIDTFTGTGTQVISLTRAHLKYSGGCDPGMTGKDEQERVHFWQYKTEAGELSYKTF
jgi:hypothetical protein